MLDDVIKWKRFPRYWPFVRGIHRSPMNSPHKGQWRGSLMFSLICALNIQFSKRSWGWWVDMQSRSLWRHCNCLHMISFYQPWRSAEYTIAYGSRTSTSTTKTTILWNRTVFVWLLDTCNTVKPITLMWRGVKGKDCFCILYSTMTWDEKIKHCRIILSHNIAIWLFRPKFQ